MFLDISLAIRSMLSDFSGTKTKYGHKALAFHVSFIVRFFSPLIGKWSGKKCPHLDHCVRQSPLTDIDIKGPPIENHLKQHLRTLPSSCTRWSELGARSRKAWIGRNRLREIIPLNLFRPIASGAPLIAPGMLLSFRGDLMWLLS